MIEGVRYVKYEGNEKLIEKYFRFLFSRFGEKKVVDVLKGYCKREGNDIDDYLSCYFATEFPDKDEEDYFGESGVAFYLDYPAVNQVDEGIVILTYDEFLNVVKKKYGEYIKAHPKRREEILSLLNLLEKTLLP